MWTLYTASKSTVPGLTRSRARDFGRRGIRVNAVASGRVMTRPCLPRKLQPAEIAKLIVLPASEEASACTHQHPVVDGSRV